MKRKLCVACAALLATISLPALALQLGQIEVKSALDQPLVAAIPLRPKSLTELQGLAVGLAPAADFARAGLQLTATDQTLRFRVVTDTNGDKLILVTSSEPITDPYLDFLVQVNTRGGKQIREFVALLNPVVATSAPVVQTPPVAGGAAASAAGQSAALPPSSAFPQPVVQAEPQPAAKPAPRPVASSIPRAAPPPQPAPRPSGSLGTAPATGVQPGGQVEVQHGDTLFGIARQAVAGSSVSIDQMMLALQAANPNAFFRDNIGDLKTGAILRVPARDAAEQRSLAAAAAEVRRQYAAWRGVKPHPATIVEGTAAQAAARTAPVPPRIAPTSDHLTLVPASSGVAAGARSRAGVAGGTGTATVMGLRQQLQDERDALVSLKQSNSDLESRVRSLENIATKSQKLLSFKDATIAELQARLAAVQSGTKFAARSSNAASPARAAAMSANRIKPVRSTAVAQRPAAHPAWYARPAAWIVAVLIVLGLLVLGLLGRHRKAGAELRGPLVGPEDAAAAPVAGDAGTTDSIAPAAVDGASMTSAHAGVEPVADDADLDAAHKPLAFAAPGAEGAGPAIGTGTEAADHAADAARLAAAFHPDVSPSANVEQAAPPAEAGSDPAVDAVEAAKIGSMDHSAAHAAHGDTAAAPAQPQPKPARVAASDVRECIDDPVDTKLDLARAYIELGDPASARALLDEVGKEGSQVQKDAARLLLANVAARAEG